MYWPRAGISAYPSLPSTAPPITRFLLFAGRFRPRTRKRPAEPGAPLDSFNERTNTTYMASASAHPRWRRARRSGIERRPGGERPPARAGLRTRRRGRHRRSDRDAARTAAMNLAQNLRLAWQRVTGRTTGCRTSTRSGSPNRWRPTHARSASPQATAGERFASARAAARSAVATRRKTYFPLLDQRINLRSSRRGALGLGSHTVATSASPTVGKDAFRWTTRTVTPFYAYLMPGFSSARSYSPRIRRAYVRSLRARSNALTGTRTGTPAPSRGAVSPKTPTSLENGARRLGGLEGSNSSPSVIRRARQKSVSTVSAMSQNQIG